MQDASVTVRTRIFSTICVVAALAILSSPALAQKSNSVIDVQVKGNKQLSRDDILADVKTRAGQPYDETIAKADQRRLLLTGRFDSVVVTKTQADKGVIVTFVVSERSLVVEISFRNNKEFDRKDLLEELPFGVGDPLNRFMVESGRQAILAKYRSDGYFFVEVTWDNAAMVTQQQVIYTIVEGPDVAIRKIRFQGNDFFSTFRLRQTVNSSSGFWPFLPGTLDMEQVERDVQGIANRYVSEGFLDAEVGRDLEFSQDKRKVVLTFVIREGPRYRVNRAIFKGNTIFSGEELARRLSLQQGGFFTALKLLRDIRKLENTYGELGYIEARAVSAKQFLDPKAPLPDWAAALDQPPALLNVVFTIVERDQFSIGQITIRGNTVTHDHVIRRQLLFFPEQLFNTVAVNKSQRRLRESRGAQRAGDGQGRPNRRIPHRPGRQQQQRPAGQHSPDPAELRSARLAGLVGRRQEGARLEGRRPDVANRRRAGHRVVPVLHRPLRAVRVGPALLVGREGLRIQPRAGRLR